jgi:DNA-directed RNA polymerase specialized sigma24 family protein
MKTAVIRKIPQPFTSNRKTHSQPEDNLDDLVRCACEGDRRAIGAIGIAFGPALLMQARAVLGEFAQEDEDVLQDFLVSLLERESCFIPGRGRAFRWMCGIVRSIARERRAAREREWEVDNVP